MKGELLIGEHIFPITDVGIYGGGFRITVVARGPLPAVTLTEYAVRGEDGQVVYRSVRKWYESATVGPLDVDSSLTFYLDLKINDRTAQPEGPVKIY